MDSRLGLLMPTGVLLLFLCHTTLVQSLPTAGSVDCSERQFEHPNHGWVNCTYICAPDRTLPGQIEFCNNVCPKYYIECGADLTTSILLSSASTHRPAVSSPDPPHSFQPPTASPHISDKLTSKAAKVEATTVTAISEHRVVASSIPTEVVSNASESEPSADIHNGLIVCLITVIAVLAILFLAGIAIWCLVYKKRSRGNSATSRRSIYTVPPIFKKKDKQLHAQETHQTSEPDYYQDLLPSGQFHSGVHRAN